MRATYIKPNSKTQAVATCNINTVKTICNRVGIDLDSWLDTMFELGCQYAEWRFQGDPDAILDAQTDKKFGFWDWWITLYISDDATVNTLYKRLNQRDYLEAKDKFYYYLTTSKDEKVQNQN